jgi:DNA-binding NarL/FixJ family response regulator
MGLRVLLENEPDIELAAEATNGHEAVEAVRRSRPDVVIMDVRMPVMDGIAALRHIVGDPSLSDTRILMLTTFEEDQFVFDALRGGASGFLLKDTDPAELLRAVRLVNQGESLLSPTVTRRVIERFAAQSGRRNAPSAKMDALTAREREMVAWVAEGMSNEEIADTLTISPATVRTHVSRAMVKLQARDRAQLVVFAFQHGLVPPAAS